MKTMKMNSRNRDQLILESLNKCARAFLKSRDFRSAAHTVYLTCKKLIGATAGYVALLSPDETENELLFLDMGDLPCALDPDLPMPIRGLRAEAYSSGEVVWENDFQQSKWLQYLPEGHGRLDNVLFAPLVIDDKALGIFGFANKPEGFHNDDVLVVKAFAELTAIGLMQNKTMQDLEQHANHLNVLMQTANDAIITVDNQGQICFWNKAAENYFGYSADEIVGQSCRCIVPEKYWDAHREGFSRFTETGVSKLAGHHIEVEGLKKNGEHLALELSISKWETDGSVFFTGIMRDISERRQMEEKIKTSEKRLREIFKMMEAGGGIYKAVDGGEDFIIIEFNRPTEWKDLLKTLNNLEGKRILDVFPACKEYGLLDVFQRVWKSGNPEYHPVIIYDGQELKSWRKNYVFKLSSGEIVALYEDITESKRMEKDLIESESLFRSIFDTTPDPINLNRLSDGKFILVNRTFLELTGYKKNEVIGKTALDINIWKDLNKRAQFFDQLLAESQVNDFEALFRCKDGTILTTLVSAKLLSYKNDPHLLAVTKDITELKKAELSLVDAHKKLAKRYEVSTEKLKETEIKYSTLIEALLTGVYMCEGEKIIFINKQFAEMFGYEREELLKMNMIDLIHPDDRKNFQTVCKIPTPIKAIDGEFELRGVRKNGETIYLSGRNTAIDYNKKFGILGNVTNITGKKIAEKELRKSEEDLRNLSAQLLSAEERERKRIASDIHDSIGQALSAIKFSVENSIMAIEEQSYPTAQQTLEKIIPLTRQSIDEVRRIIMDLRPSTLDDLGLVATISWFCREYVSIYQDTYIEKEIQVEEEDIPKSLKTVIYRIMQEAFNNAAKHSGKNFIRIHLVKNAENLTLLIEDNGVGFDLEMLRSGPSKHKGMGLTSMKERAQLSGGTFNIQSTPGVGTKIHIVWPLKALAAGG